MSNFPEISSKEDAELEIERLESLMNSAESRIQELAVQFRIHVSLGDYGSGRSIVLLDPDELDDEDRKEYDKDPEGYRQNWKNWNGYRDGEWMSSSESC